MVTLANRQLVDVVVDVQTAHLDGPFTYALEAEAPVGARVRVPLGERMVFGWIVGTPSQAHAGDVKPVVEICDEPAIPPDAVALAAWMRRRYTCTFREALGAVAPRVGAPPQRVQFQQAPQTTDATVLALHRRYRDKPFSALGADRSLRALGLRMPLAAIRRRLARLVADGVLVRVRTQARGSRSRTAGDQIAVLVDAGRARGPAQRRLAEALADAAGKLPVAEARRRARASTATLKAAWEAGMLRFDAQATRSSGVASTGPAVTMSPTDEQQAAICRLEAAIRDGPVTALLHGVTGSGKTFVYLRLIDGVRACGGRAIVLVPEIALTPQTAGRFVSAFGSTVGVLHSGLSEAQRAAVWAQAAQGSLDVVVGARSAVFAPLPDLRLVVVDEEHEASYKQDVAPRYDAAAVAIARMRRSGGAVVLGSATPSLETYWAARQGHILHERLTQRATNAPLPQVEVVDMTQRRGLRGRRALGPALCAAIESRLAAGHKTLLFVNRRGYAGLLLCRACGFAPRCRRCAISLVVHAHDRSMRCHVCGDGFRMPGLCPKCGSADLAPFGCGTQRVEEEVRELFPSARVVRMDSDSTSALGSHERLLRSFEADGDILIGTQMIAKGLDYPTVTLVGVVAADLDLNRPDFRAAERTFSLLTQVAGRAGRAAPGSTVIVQAYAPGHYAIERAARHDYEGFARQELAARQELGYPPFGRMAYIIIAGISLQAVGKTADDLAAWLRGQAGGVEVLGPAPDALAKARGEFRMRIALRAADEEALLERCAAVRERRVTGVRTTVIVDPR